MVGVAVKEILPPVQTTVDAAAMERVGGLTMMTETILEVTGLQPVPPFDVTVTRYLIVPTDVLTGV